MSARPHTEIDVAEIKFGAEAIVGKDGRKNVRVSLDGKQVEFQLGSSVHDALRCPFGVGFVSKEQGETRKQIRIEVDGAVQAWLVQFEAAVARAAEDNCVGWFKKTVAPEHLAEMHNSSIRPSSGDYPDLLKLRIVQDPDKRPTEVYVASLGCDGVLEQPSKGTIDDITAGSYLLPIVRVQGGVYFVNRNSFGTSLVASKVLVVRRAEEVPMESEEGGFTLGDVVVREA